MAERWTGTSLLPPNATAIEVAESLVSAEHRDKVPWSDLPAVFDPERCPVRLLNWLATVFSVDVWLESWPEARKRYAIANAIRLHRLKGTLQGITEYLGLIDVGVVRAVTPPARFYLSDDDGAAYDQWVSLLPEVRVYHYRSDSSNDTASILAEAPADQDYEDVETVEPVGLFLADPEEGDYDPTDEERPSCFTLALDQPIQSGLRAVMVQNGVETELGIESENEWDARDEVNLVEQVFFPDTKGAAFYCDGGWLDADFLHDGERRYVAFIRRHMRRASDMGAPLVRGREIVDAEPTRHFLDQSMKGMWFLDTPQDGWFLSAERDLLFDYYDSWRLVDPEVPATFGPNYSFLDFDRFSMAPYTAELMVDITEPATRNGFYLDTPGDLFLWETDFQRLQDACDVTVIAASRRDRIYLDLSYQTRPSLRQTYRFADLRLR